MGKKYEQRDTTHRSHTVSVRFSDDEYDRLKYICKELNVYQSEYIRDAALTAKIVRPMMHSVMDYESTQKLLAHFGKIGSNLNQIARALNQDAHLDSRLRKELHNCICELQKGASIIEAVGGAD